MHRDSSMRSAWVYMFAGLLAWAQPAIADGWMPLSSGLGYFQKGSGDRELLCHQIGRAHV